MATRTVTMNQLLDEAVAKLPFVRRRVMQYRLLSSKYRQGIIAELTLKMYDEPDLVSMQSVFGSDSFNGDKPFGIDVDKLEQVLQLIIKYLPQIISLFQNLFSAGLFMLVLSLGDTAMAQCANGQCRMPQRPVQRVVNAVPLLAPAPAKATCTCGCNMEGCNCSKSSQLAAPPIMQQTNVRGYRGPIRRWLGR